MILIRRWIGIFAVIVCQLAGIALFARGFFPKKIILTGHGTYFPTNDTTFSTYNEDGEGPMFDKMIFMVVDAMRSDYIFSTESNMPFLHSLINKGCAVGFTAHSTPPTVTLPRIKGITTGTTPNFLDAILNIAESDSSSTLANQDNWISQLKCQNKRIHMFGDDTWIKLFPNHFDRVDGTASFFVSDFTEVDNNVTRHIDHELKEQNWDLMILHYLGLDHIGHKGGPTSPFMPIKQKEMDDVIKSLYTSLEKSNTLLIVAGDHGMNGAGNHGGSSAGETSAGLAFVSPKFAKLKLHQKSPLLPRSDFNYYDRIQQSDLVPTIAAFLDIPIPINNLGVFIRDFLPLWKTKKTRTLILEQNAREIANILESNFAGFLTVQIEDQIMCEANEDYADLDHLKCLWWSLEDSFDDENTVYEFLELASSVLSKVASNYVESDMIFGIVLLCIATIIASTYIFSFLKDVKYLRNFFFGFVILYAVSMFGSSLVEEEHHFWYWAATGWISMLYIIGSRVRFRDGINWFFCLVLVRIIREWNQTGQKCSGDPDITKYLSLTSSSTLLWLLIIMTYCSLFDKIWRNSFSRLPGIFSFGLSFITVISSFFFKAVMAYESGEPVPKWMLNAIEANSVGTDANDKLVSLARFFFSSIGAGILYRITTVVWSPSQNNVDNGRYHLITDICYLTDVFFVNQSKTSNIPLFLFLGLLRDFLAKAINRSFIFSSKSIGDAGRFYKVIITIISITGIIMQHVTFFAMGNSNSLASIDLSNAYNGVSEYNITLVGALTFLSNWVGPCYWSISTLMTMFEDDIRNLIICEIFTKFKLKNSIKKYKETAFSMKVFFTLLFSSVAMLGVMGACLVLKHHLFIWTVFSPKLLYVFAWSVIQFSVVDVGLSALLLITRAI
ncbi:alkaline phosphatase-like protein [Nadsonia fulvescens var. elongata DSM 6958]|uniref:GPI ethanolamine phosphate transferase 2 n=1 Tax=Nadsonia fulvescens var. elongata DSM 6958 TaxID=857566 RepID=A0A1E3PHC3_9ASCO|nr:alkaline phosphatase-like protein [Nadsonia fulvescens var. elongata DSM 6958]